MSSVDRVGRGEYWTSLMAVCFDQLYRSANLKTFAEADFSISMEGGHKRLIKPVVHSQSSKLIVMSIHDYYIGLFTNLSL